MFRFWATDSRGTKATTPPDEPDFNSERTISEKPTSPTAQPLNKRRRDSEQDDSLTLESLHKRPRLDERIQQQIDNAVGVIDSMDDAEDRIESAFQLQITLKHEERRLIDLRIAECQAALEQLRRVHLKPYPVNCPTPEQMLDVSAGKGYALQQPGAPVPQYAPPYGVVDGPYSRHYEKWLIPHRDFDGVEYVAHQATETTRMRASFAAGRSTRNSFAEPSSLGRRVSIPAPKLQALSSGQPQRKANAGPCVLKRSDGQTVKLVCIDCHRENFSSTQGFINHCRIAHKRDFKSHDEAAMKSGQPYESAEGEGGASQPEQQGSAQMQPPAQTPVAPPVQTSRQLGIVNPLARNDITYQEACTALSARVAAALQSYKPSESTRGVSKATPKKTDTQKPSPFKTAPETPYLSRLLQSRKFSGNLHDLVTEAKTKVSLDDITPGEDSDDEDSSASNVTPDAVGARVPVVKRVPARTTKSPAPHAGRPASSKALAHELNLARTSRPAANDQSSSDEDVDMEEPSLSPNTLISNNAPSLVSDDGEYDDSDEGSSISGHSEAMDADSVSDVAEITMDDDHDHRTLRRTSTGVPSAVKLRGNDPKHVSIVGPMAGNRNGRTRKA